MVADIEPNVQSGSSPTDLVVFNNALYFEANVGTSGDELWKYDGTSASMVADIYPNGNSNPNGFIVFNNELYFQANDGTNGNELWKYDGVNAPSMIADIYSGSSSSSPSDLVVFNDDLYFHAASLGDFGSLFKYSIESTITYS